MTHESRTEVFLPPCTLDCTAFFFCCSLTLGVKVVALANRRKSIAWRLQEFFRYPPKSVQDDAQLLTVRPHLYMNAAAPLYKRPQERFFFFSFQGHVKVKLVNNSRRVRPT